jgi:hypothetical protein
MLNPGCNILILIVMKRILLMTMIVFCVLSFSFAGIVIRVNLSIGRKSQPATCPGIGFCSFSVGSSNMEGLVNGTLDINEARGSMIIAIAEKDIQKYQPDKLVFFKNKSNLIFTEDYTMPGEINSAAKVTKPLIVKKGTFPLSYKQGMYFIEIPY